MDRYRAEVIIPVKPISPDGQGVGYQKKEDVYLASDVADLARRVLNDIEEFEGYTGCAFENIHSGIKTELEQLAKGGEDEMQTATLL